MKQLKHKPILIMMFRIILLSFQLKWWRRIDTSWAVAFKHDQVWWCISKWWRGWDTFRFVLL